MASDPAGPDVTRFDYLVIGGGSGGLASARRASELGASTAVIESHKLGGTCVSKAIKTLFILLCTLHTHTHKYTGCQCHCEASGLLLWKYFLCTINIVGSAHSSHGRTSLTAPGGIN